MVSIEHLSARRVLRRAQGERAAAAAARLRIAARICALAAAVLAGGGLLAGAATGGSYRIDAQAIAGGGSRSGNACFTLTSTIAQPLAGAAQGGSFQVTAGFLAATAGSTDSLFSDAFEACAAP